MGKDSDPLPVVSYTKIEDEASTQPAGVHDLQARSFGYNDFSEFKRPEGHYIRHIEPLESELAVQVEYDMDEQDQEWLDAVNAERKKEQVCSMHEYKTVFHRADQIPKGVEHLILLTGQCYSGVAGPLSLTKITKESQSHILEWCSWKVHWTLR